MDTELEDVVRKGCDLRCMRGEFRFRRYLPGQGKKGAIVGKFVGDVEKDVCA